MKVFLPHFGWVPKGGEKPVNSKYVHVPEDLRKEWNKSNVFRSLAHHLSWRHIIGFKGATQLCKCLWVWETDVWHSQRQIQMLGSSFFFNYSYISLYKGVNWRCAFYCFTSGFNKVGILFDCLFVYPTSIWTKICVFPPSSHQSWHMHCTESCQFYLIIYFRGSACVD